MPSNVFGSKQLMGMLASFLFLLTVCHFIAPEAFSQSNVPPPSGWADTVVVNGKIATMNDSQRFVEALAIRDGRIATTGTNQQIERFRGPNTKVLDVGGRTVFPGLITAHDHPHLWISWFHSTGSKVNTQWDSVPAIGKTPDEAAASILRTIEQATKQRKPNEWILIRTDEDGTRAIRGGLLTEEMLNKAAPNNPVLLRAEYIDLAVSKNGKVLNNIEAVMRAYQGEGPPLRSAARTFLINAKAKEAFKAHGKDLSKLSPTGGAGAVMLELIPKSVGIDSFAEGIRRELQFWAATQGVTTIASTWFRDPSVITAFSRLARRGEMPIRMAWFTSIDQLDFGSEEGVGDPYLWNIGAEYEGVVLEEMRVGEEDPSLDRTPIGDATLYASSIPLKDPRLEKVRADFISRALLALPGTPGRKAIMDWLRLGVRVGDVHCYSDGAVDMFIGILKELQKETGWSEEKIRNMRNFYLTHLALVRPEQIPEIKRWGMTVGPSWRTMFDLPRLKTAYGEEIKKYVWPVKSLLAAGVPVSPNVDMSPTVGPEGEGMWDILEFLVDREYAGEEWNKAEAVDRWDALKTLTIFGARTALREDSLGSLEVGKYADLVVLDKDYFTIPSTEISTLTPVLTMVGGDVKFQKDGISFSPGSSVTTAKLNRVE
ncbi:MAG: amidohydrolase family protein [Acidobacteria bacterium]|nr:amidohydrolase family protein [Acidobacteriota bacterium]